MTQPQPKDKEVAGAEARGVDTTTATPEEPLAQQIAVASRAKDVASKETAGASPSPAVLGARTSVAIQEGFEDALDKMFTAYSNQHQGIVDSYRGIKSLLQVSFVLAFFRRICTPSPQVPRRFLIKESTWDLSVHAPFLLHFESGVAPCP